MKTRLQFKGLSFSLMSFPFNVVPDQKIALISTSSFTQLTIIAEPKESCESWQADLLDGQEVCFKGIKAGTSELIEMTMMAQKAVHPENHLIISFGPVTTPTEA